MDELEIRKYARLMEELNLTGLEFPTKGGKIRLERAAAPETGEDASASAAGEDAADGRDILWILGYRMSADHKVTAKTRTVLEITIDIKYGREARPEAEA